MSVVSPSNSASALCRCGGARGVRRLVCRAAAMLPLAMLLATVGCGTTRMTDTRRTATEQLLISNAIDRSLDEMDVRPLRGKHVYLDETYLKGVQDEQYLISALRQKLLLAGVILCEKAVDADYIVEARSGVVGTDSYNVVFGVPAVNIPPAVAAINPAGAAIPAIPEIPLVKRSSQRGLARVTLYAYERESRIAYWQSGSRPGESNAKDVWVVGAGPFQWGTIYETPRLAGGRLRPLKFLRELWPEEPRPTSSSGVRLTDTAVFHPPVNERPGQTALVTFVDDGKPPPRAPAAAAPKPAATQPKASPSPKPAETEGSGS